MSATGDARARAELTPMRNITKEGYGIVPLLHVKAEVARGCKRSAVIGRVLSQRPGIATGELRAGRAESGQPLRRRVTRVSDWLTGCGL
jgi:hypothetical protein